MNRIELASYFAEIVYKQRRDEGYSMLVAFRHAFAYARAILRGEA